MLNSVLRRVLFPILIIVACAGSALAMEFSADSVTTFNGKQMTAGKMYYKQDRFRMDMKAQGDMIAITRMDKKVIWNIMPSEKMYMEMPLDLKNRPMVEKKFQGEIERKEVGSETVNGHPTKKYLITYKADNKKEQVYQWMATDINFPVRTSAVDGSWAQEFRNIKIGPQPSSLFEVPSGYRKMQMPQMPGGMNFLQTR